jgi:hypothetical protein
LKRPLSVRLSISPRGSHLTDRPGHGSPIRGPCTPSLTCEIIPS